MNSVAVVGVSHQATPAAVRERLHLAPDGAAALARSLSQGGAEAVVLATCNRTEFYLAAPDLAEATQQATAALVALGGKADVLSTSYTHCNEFAARQLFRVCSGLDAIVLGDTHVAAQVRQAHRLAKTAGATGPLLDRLFERAAEASKRIRSQTSLSSGPKSIPAAAMAAVARRVDSLAECRLLVIGAGTIATLVALNAASRGCVDIVIANKNVRRARELADRVGGRFTSLDVLEVEVGRADIIVSATAAPEFVLTSSHARAAFGSGCVRPRLILDLALPRDVDPVFRDQPQMHLLDLDDLARFLVEGWVRRRGGLERAEAIAREEAERYDTWRRSRAAVPAIVTLRSNAERARSCVLSRHAAALRRLAPQDQRLVETITAELVGKVLHEPTLELRRQMCGGRNDHDRAR